MKKRITPRNIISDPPDGCEVRDLDSGHLIAKGAEPDIIDHLEKAKDMMETFKANGTTFDMACILLVQRLRCTWGKASDELEAAEKLFNIRLER